MSSLIQRPSRIRCDDFGELNEEFKLKIKDIHWLVYFFEDEKLMVVAAGFSGIECNLAQRALAKVGDIFIFKFMEKTSLARYTGKFKTIGHKSYVEKCLTLLSQACKEQSGEPDLEFSSHYSPSPNTSRSQMVEVMDVLEVVPSQVSFS